jgi:hypothetical protein
MTPLDSKGRPVRPTRRKPGERRDEKHVYLSNVRMDPASHALLRLAAAQRAVHMTTLVNDLLNLWLAHAMDPKQEAVRLASAGRGPAPVPERFAGYLASLGYAMDSHMPTWATPVPAPPLDPHGHDPEMAPRYPLPPQEVLKALVAENAAIAEGLTIANPAPQIEPQSEPVLEPWRNPLRIGSGNAAQQWEMGPGSDLPGPEDFLPSHARKL